ncbi:MAG: HtaA domain-containing protein [Leucobacter sp.]
MNVTERRKGRSLVATLTSALLVASGLALAPSAALAAPAAGEGTVAGATLEWGVKESFRKYIGGVIAKGKITMLGGAQQKSSGTFAWAGGSGTAAVDGTAADVAFAAGDGVHFQGHSMQIDGETKYVLDGSFSAPRIVVTSATTAELRMDVAGYEFKSTSEIGEPYSLTDAPVATLQLPTSTVAGDVRTWTNAPATLTTEGAIAFGGGAFYQAGDALDPVTFSLPVTVQVPAVETTTGLTASASSITEGDTVKLTATVAPATAAGTVAFAANGTQLANPITVSNGVATLDAAQLPVGTAKLAATFTPADADAFTGSVSSEVTVDVKAKRDPITVTVSKTTGIDPDGETVTVTGTGFLPDAPATNGTRPPLAGKFAGTYVVFGSFAENWQPSKDAPAGARATLDTKWAVHAADIATIGGAARGGIEVKPDGTFSTTLNLTKDEAKEIEGGRYGIYTYAGGGVKYAPFESYTEITFAVPAQDTTVEVAASADSLVSGDQVTLTAAVSKGVAGSVQFKSNGKALGEPVEVQNDEAVLKTNDLVEVGANDVTADFTPANTDAYNASTSAAVSVAVTERPTPKVTVTKKSGIDPAGETVTVTGTGFLPKAPVTNGQYPPFAGKFSGVYVVFGSFADQWAPSTNAPSSARKTFDTKWAVQAAELPAIAAMGGVELKADGSFETTLKLSKDSAKALADGTYGVYTYAGGGVKYAPFETKTVIEFAPAHETTVAVDASKTAIYAGDEVELTATVTDDVAGSVQFQNNGKPLGEPVEVAQGSAALKTSALALGMSEVTAQFIPANSDVFATSVSAAVTVAVAPQPTLLINGKPADKLKLTAGDRVDIKVGPFAAGTGFSVEIHSEVVELPGLIEPDVDGFVNATWTVPADFELGQHDVVVTETDSGRAFAFKNAFTVVKKAVVDGGTDGENTGKTPVTTNSGSGQNSGKGLANSGSAPATAAFAVAGAMLLLGAGTVLLRRRQGANAE